MARPQGLDDIIDDMTAMGQPQELADEMLGKRLKKGVES